MIRHRSSVSSTARHALAAVAVAVALTSPSVVAMRSQLEFAACAVNHAPQYFCCEYGEEKELFTRFNRPSGPEYDQFYQDGWKIPRQVNFPDAFYAPDSPSFNYHDPSQVCRVQRVFNKATKTTTDTLQCGPATSIANDHGGSIVTNDSLPADSQDAEVFWKSRTSARNSNASFPIGASCRSLMLPNGKVDEAARAACVPPMYASQFRFNTYTEAPLVAVYVLYGALMALLVLWVPVRGWLGVLRRSGASHMTHNSLSASPVLIKAPGYHVPGYKHDPNRSMDENSGGLAMPMLTRRNTDVELRAAADAIEQTGYRDSLLGKCVLVYLLTLTLLLFPIMIILILDSNYHFQPALFDPVNVLIIAYILVWLITTVWLSLFVFSYEKLRNYFRVHEPLSHCQYVTMFNPDASEILLTDRSGVSQFIAHVEQWLFPRSRQGYEETMTVETSADGHRYVEFQHLRYIYDELYGKFVPGSVPFPETYSQIREQLQHGLTSQEVKRRQAIVGTNALEVPMPTTATSIAKEVFHPFYIYELMCYYVWFFTGYYIVAVLNSVIIVCVLAFNIYAKRRLLANVLKMTRTQGGVAVHRDGVWQTIKVSQLVPGDLVRVVENWDLPCDLVLLKGNVLCDESSLTGESMPVQKFPIPTQSHELYDPEDQTGKKHTLFAGGRTLASANASRLLEQHDDLLAVVASTGAHTIRGQLVQSILYPAKVRFKYEEHLKACILFLLGYGVIAAVIAMRLLIGNAGLSNTLFAFVYGMFMLSAVLSPLIPVVLTVGNVNASKRLQARGIFCLNATRVSLSGKVRVFAFDKTGTITKEGLDMRGVVPVDTQRVGRPPKPQAMFGRERSDVANPDVSLLLKYALATCHAVGYLDDELVGNEVEVKMLEATQWRLVEELVVDANGRETVRSIVESPDRQHALEILKRFEFDHTRASMSVVVEEMHTRRRFVFCKGSYEKLQEICGAHTLPLDYSQCAERLAKDGCYVLGLGVKELPKAAISLDLEEALSLSYTSSIKTPATQQQQQQQHLDTMARDDMEKDLSLLGLLLFQNELKDDSADVIAKLKEGDIRVVMITGDNAMTGCYIARHSGMVRPGARVVLGEILVVNDHGARGLVWRDVDTMEIVPSRDVFDMAELSGKHAQHEHDRWELAVTGAAFNYLRKMGELPKLLFHIRIFSRMTPVEKADCVAEMMAAGAVTGMCGDGGNDCGALRIAHVGVALSDTEASVVSPFTSQRKSIVSVLDVVREGRCSLKTSFGNLKFLMMYGMIGCGLRMTMYANAVFLPEYSFMFCDGLVLVGMSYAISLAKPLRTLGKHRPTASLVGATTILSMLGQELIHVLFLYFGVGMLFDASWYCPFNPQNIDLVKWWLLQDTHLASTLFVIVAPQYIVTALSNGFGSRFHQPVHRNYVLVGYTVILLSMILYLAVGEPSAFTDRFRMASSTNVMGLPEIPMPASFRWKLVLLVACNMLAIVIYERVIVLGPVKRWLRSRFHRDVLQLRL